MRRQSALVISSFRLALTPSLGDELCLTARIIVDETVKEDK